MDRAITPKKKKSKRWLANAALQNPVLVQATGLTVLVAVGTTLQGALVAALVTAAHLIICEMLACSMKRVPAWLRVAVYFAVGLAIACPAAYAISNLMDYLSRLGDIATKAAEAALQAGDSTREAAQSLLAARRLAQASALSPLRIFLPVMSVSALVAVRCERYAILHTRGDALKDAAANSLGFLAAALIAGGTRELLGYGTLWGIELSDNLHLRGAWMPFGGFLLLGAMAGVLKVILRALSSRGIYAGAEKALEMAPEDRLERLEKTRRLLIADVKEAEAEIINKKEDTGEIEEEEPEPEPAPEPEPEPETPARPKIPVDDILKEYGLDESSGLPRAMTEDDKMRLVLELEELLDEFKGGDAQ